VLTVAEVARIQQVTPRTVRSWLQRGVLAGQKIGPVWGVWWPAAWGGTPGRPRRQTRQDAPSTVTLAMVRTRLRQVGHQLITVGNTVAGSPRRRGHVFLTWRRARSLQIVLALGRQSPRHGWAPHALGTDLPFWLQERSQWSRVLPLLRWYERLRGWCHPRLLRVPGVGPVLLAEIVRLERALRALEAPEVPAEDPAASNL
jgi:hypothetical protein